MELLNSSSEGVTLAQLTKSSGFVKNKVFRILFTLEKHHLVERDEFGRFYLGTKFIEFGQHVQKQTTLIEASRQVMDLLVAETSESIFLGVVSGAEVLVYRRQRIAAIYPVVCRSGAARATHVRRCSKSFAGLHAAAGTRGTFDYRL